MPEKIDGLHETIMATEKLDDEKVFDEKEIGGVDGQIATEHYCVQERNKLLDFDREV